ncbi:MAG: hypothetical protein WDN45_09350 [Caulobacteraceae bacterium]
MSQISIAETLGMDRATIMAIIDRLEARGLGPAPPLHRRPPPGKELYLTEQGRTYPRPRQDAQPRT